MPHIIIEHSPRLEAELSIETLVERLHAKAMTIDAFPVGGLRVRSKAADYARTGDGDEANNFIYVTVRMGQGRDAAIKRDIGDRLFDVIAEFTQAQFDANLPLSLGLEIQEIEKDFTWKKNNIHQIVKDKS